MNFLSRLLGQETYKSCKKSWDTLSNCLSSIDFSKKEAIDEMSKWMDKAKELNTTFTTELNSLKEKLKFVTNERTLEIPYDRDTQILKVEVLGDFFNVVVEGSGDNPIVGESTSCTSVYIPLDSCVEGIKQRYDKSKRAMIFTFNPCDNSVDAEDDFVEETEDTPTDIILEMDDEEDGNNNSLSYEENLRINVLKDRENGMSFRAIGKKHGISDKRAARIIRSNGME